MKRTLPFSVSLTIALTVVLICATAAFGQFPAQIVYDPFNEVHFIAEVNQLVSSYAELVATYNQIVSTYNQIVYNATILKNKSQWILALNNWVHTAAPDTYLKNSSWVSAVNTGIGIAQAYGTLTAPLHTYNLATVPSAFQQKIEQQYAAVQLIDGTTQQGLQTVGQYKGEELNRAGTISALGKIIGSSDPDSNSEVATLGTISTATILALQEAHGNTAINASLLEQHLQEQNQRRQALAYAINSDIYFRENEPAAYAQHNTNTTLALQNLVIP